MGCARRDDAEMETIRLSLADYRALIKIVEKGPTKPNAALRAAARRFKADVNVGRIVVSEFHARGRHLRGSSE